MKNPKKRGQIPEVIFQPKTHVKMKQGIDLMVNAIRPTLGPLPRAVAIAPLVSKNVMPELLDSGGTIARRVVQVRDRDADMGAMYVRHVIWELYERVGDGTATAAVIFQSIFNQGLRYLTAGGNAMRLRHYLEEAFKVLDTELAQRVEFLEGKQALSQLALTICHDLEMAKLMGEIFDIIGEFGRLEIRKGNSRQLEREYVEGMYWEGGLVSREFITEPEKTRAAFDEALILVSDLDIQEPKELIPLLEMLPGIPEKTIRGGDLKLAGEKPAGNGRMPALFLMTANITDRALSILLANRQKVPVITVKIPGITIDAHRAALEDIAVLTGAQPLIKQAGNRLENVTFEHLGKARRIWANLNNLVIVGGKGDARQLRQHIASLRASYNNQQDPQNRKHLLERIGKLLGGSATLWVGDTTPLAVDARKEVAERTADAMRGAMREGVVPGGGAAFLEIRGALQERMHQVADLDQRTAYSILYRALEAPTRVLLENAGLDSFEVMAQIRQAGSGWGCDVLTGMLVNMRQAGIYDSAAVTRQALFSAVHGAALALTTDVLVHRRIRPESISKTG